MIGNSFVTISQYFYWYFSLNVLVFISNLPFVIALYRLKLNRPNLILFFISLIPLGVSLGSLLSCLNKIKVEKDLESLKDYLYFYREGYQKISIIWIISLSLLTILVSNTLFVMNTGYFPVLMPPNMILMSLLISMFLCGLTLTTKFNTNLKETFKLSFYFSVRKCYLALVNVMLFITWGFVTILRPVMGLLVLPSLIFFLIVQNNEWITKVKKRG